MKEINIQKKSKNSLDVVGKFLEKISGNFEIIFILLIWFFIFSNSQNLGGFTIQDMVAYLLVGNLIGLFTSYLLKKTVDFNIGQSDMKMFHYKPIPYILRVFFRSAKKILIPFLLSISLNIVLLYFFVNTLYLNTDFYTLILIIVMMLFSFLIELFLAFILDLYVFWSFESAGLLKIISRLKKIFAGAYFPLNFLGKSFLTISLFFPFAYSFYVPAQLYLKNISFRQGVYGLFVQFFWIVIFYIVIKISWRKKMEALKKSQERKSLLE